MNDPNPPTASEPGGDTTSSQGVNWAVVAHLSALVGLLGIPSPVGPAVVWALKSDDPEAVAAAKEALNFNISFFIYGIVAALSLFVLIGFLLLPAVVIGWLILVVVAGVKTANGEAYRYPLTIRFIS